MLPLLGANSNSSRGTDSWNDSIKKHYKSCPLSITKNLSTLNTKHKWGFEKKKIELQNSDSSKKMELKSAKKRI